MAGRFPLYTDNDVHGDLVKALLRARWDVVRGIDTFPENTPDPEHFEKAAELGRALVTNDQPLVEIAHQWVIEGRRFTGMVTWPHRHYARMTFGDILRKFDELADLDEPFHPDYPIVRFHPD